LFLLGQKADTANLDAADASSAMDIALTTGENPLEPKAVNKKFKNIDEKLNFSVEIEQALAKAD
jgi:hypothetical protein